MFLDRDVLKYIGRALIVAPMLLASAAWAQTPPAPNISGTWVLVDFGGTLNKSDPRFPKMTLVIEQEANQLKVTEKRIKQGKEEVRTFAYNVDGQGDTNTDRVEVWRSRTSKFESVTRVDKDRIVTEYTGELALGTSSMSVSGPRTTAYFSTDTVSKRRDQWSVDASGKNLTLTTKVLSMNSKAVTGSIPPPANSPIFQGDAAAPSARFATGKLKFRRI